MLSGEFHLQPFKRSNIYIWVAINLLGFDFNLRIEVLHKEQTFVVQIIISGHANRYITIRNFSFQKTFSELGFICLYLKAILFDLSGRNQKMTLLAIGVSGFLSSQTLSGNDEG